MDTQHNERCAAVRSSVSPERAAPALKNASTGSPNGIRSSPPMPTKHDAMDLDVPDISPGQQSGKSDSEAETIVLPGKDGHSPSKIRKSIKHEDKSDDEHDDVPSTSHHAKDAKDAKDAAKTVEREKNLNVLRNGNGGQPGETSSSMVTSSLGKRKRQKLNGVDDGLHVGNSSGLSSVPTSPLATTTRSSLSKPAASDSDISKSASPAPRPSLRDKAKSVDRALPRKKRYDPDSGEEEDDIEERRSARQRVPGTKLLDVKSRKETRSTSPQPRSHRRSISTQLPAKSSYGLSHKKKRIPPPLQSTEYQSDDSSASGSSYPRSSRLRSLAAPHTGDSTMSPIKTGSHKKHVNSSGQTFLQRACASNKSDQLAQVKQRYEERPQDLNESDHAGNTPLHSASIHGHVKVVKFLLDTGNCIVDPLNIQKDTPLHDSLENGHVDVVKLLLDAGSDPRKPKGDGKDPLDIIAEKTEEDEDDPERLADWERMRILITTAIKKHANVRQDSEDDRHERSERGLSHVTESPRQTPPVHGHEFPNVQTGTRRAGVGTSRQVKTKDGNLYQPMNLAELRKAARDGDDDTTTRILEVMPNTNDPKTLWLSARGGHSNTMQFQLAMGKFDPDPGPLEEAEPGKDTPFLVAIGRGNHLNVLKLLLTHRVDPTRLVNGETYFEIARRRKGPNWQEEFAILKEAYDNHKISSKSSPSKARSPGLRRDMRDSHRDKKSSQKEDDQSTTNRKHSRSSSDPKAKETTSKPVHRRNSSSMDHPKDPQLVKRGPGRPRKEGNTAHAPVSDHESSPPPKPKTISKKSESEVTLASDNEATTKPRRKLITGKEYRGEQNLEKSRRTSVVSNSSSVSTKDKRERGLADSKVDKDHKVASKLSRNTSKSNETDHVSDKHLTEKDRARSLKRDDSKDRLSAIRGDSPVKRPRKSSETPPRSSGQENSAAYSTSGGVPKRRKLEGESKRNVESTPSLSPEHQTKVKSNLSRESSVRSNTDTIKQPRPAKVTGEASKEAKRPSTLGESAQNSTKMSSHSSSHEAPGKGLKSQPPAPTGKDDGLPPSKSNKDEEAKEARQLQEKEARELSKKREEEEILEATRVEEAKQSRLAREQAAKEEEAKHEREETERKERQRQDDADARTRLIEDQRALYMEQERIKREDQERRRAVALEQQRAEKARLEKQKREDELAKLPYLLRWFDAHHDRQNLSEVTSHFTAFSGYRCDTIQPEKTGQPAGREQWMLNTQVAILLGEQDLQLSRYTAWERIPLTEPMKRGVWNTQADWFTMRNFSLPVVLRNHFPKNSQSPFAIVEQNRALFLGLNLFFVKLSEFMFVVPNFPHLRGVEMQVIYAELNIPLLKPGPMPPPKWKLDPDVDPADKFGPRPKFYVNGEFTRTSQPGSTRLLGIAPPNNLVPRIGLLQIHPGDPDYERISKQQGLSSTQTSPTSSTIPQVPETDQRPRQTNGITPPGSDASKSINGSPHGGSVSEHQGAPQLPNGVNEHSSPIDPSTIS